MEIDLEKVNTALDRISKFLNQMDVNHRRIDVDGIPALIMTFTFDEKENDRPTSRVHQFLVIITTDGEWIAIKSLVGSREDIPQDRLCDIYRECLQANFALEELTFSADKDGDIFVEADMLSDVRFEDFKEEFSSMIIGMRVFIDIMKKHGVDTINTSKKRQSKQFRHHTIDDLMYM